MVHISVTEHSLIENSHHYALPYFATRSCITSETHQHSRVQHDLCLPKTSSDLTALPDDLTWWRYLSKCDLTRLCDLTSPIVSWSVWWWPWWFSSCSAGLRCSSTTFCSRSACSTFTCPAPSNTSRPPSSWWPMLTGERRPSPSSPRPLSLRYCPG